MNICVVGTGYVGLVTGACFAEFGNVVTCVDKEASKIEALQEGRIPIYEPGLEGLVKRNVGAGRLKFTMDLDRTIQESLVNFIAVGTPQGNDGRADLSFVREVAGSIARNLNAYKVVVTKSTVPAGTGRMIREIIEKDRPEDLPFSVCSNPEFLREGSAIEDFMRPNRVVLGVEDEMAEAILKDLYRPLYLIETPVVVTGVVTAEVPKFLHPGPGYGGSCFPKDTRAILELARDNDLDLKIVDAVIGVNDARPERMMRKIREAMGGDPRDRTVALLGLTFKPNTDDLRESPAMVIMKSLIEQGARVRAYDPVAMPLFSNDPLPGVEYCEDEYDAAKGAEALVLATEWNQFRSLDFDKLKRRLERPLVIDLRNIYEPALMREQGFEYTGVGR
jgi:UDPglucose 6-dehydrogenase